MTIESDPLASFPVVLSQHQALPVGQQPTLHFRFPRRREIKRLDALLKRLQALQQDSDEAAATALMDEIEQAVRGLLAGWERQRYRGEPLPYNPADLDLAVDDGDLGELLGRLRYEAGLQAADKKKFARPSPSSLVRAAMASAEPGSPASPASAAPSASGV